MPMIFTVTYFKGISRVWLQLWGAVVLRSETFRVLMSQLCIYVRTMWLVEYRDKLGRTKDFTEITNILFRKKSSVFLILFHTYVDTTRN